MLSSVTNDVSCGSDGILFTARCHDVWSWENDAANTLSLVYCTVFRKPCGFKMLSSGTERGIRLKSLQIFQGCRALWGHSCLNDKNVRGLCLELGLKARSLILRADNILPKFCLKNDYFLNWLTNVWAALQTGYTGQRLWATNHRMLTTLTCQIQYP